MSSTADPAWFGDSATRALACRLPAALQKGTVITFPLIHWPYSMKSTWMQVSDQGQYKLVDGYLSYSSGPDLAGLWANAVLRSLLSIEGELHTPVDTEEDRRGAGEAHCALSTRARWWCSTRRSMMRRWHISRRCSSNAGSERGVVRFSSRRATAEEQPQLIERRGLRSWAAV